MTQHSRRHGEPLPAQRQSSALQSLARAWFYDHFLKDGALTQSTDPAAAGQGLAEIFLKSNPLIHRPAVCVRATYGEVPSSADPKVSPKTPRQNLL